MSAFARALSALVATIRLSLAKPMSRQVESSNAPAAGEAGAADAVVVVVTELDCAAEELAEGDWADVDPEDESLLEHPAAINATAMSPAIENRFSIIGTSIA
ncbi:hypothetical protein [Mycolicibacterium sphagni]|uniref:Secreted protein n=1 Tax=Mycolicibacterium sphagni TaxID=1786 RepID=A0ABX2JPY1_9MYCO|nr:hypothetical protein [Mycolicibacterium sphagni]NTY58849.1 hypothetical protein [Mycolicibacterium sphagni]